MIPGKSILNIQMAGNKMRIVHMKNERITIKYSLVITLALLCWREILIELNNAETQLVFIVSDGWS